MDLKREEIDMNYYKQGNAANADKIKAAFESKGYDVWRWKFNSTDGLYFSNQFNNKISYSENEVFCNLIKTHPDYKKLELPVEPKFKAEDRIVSKSDKSTIYRIIDLHEERREYIVEIEHKDYHESCPWIAFEDQDNFELVPKKHYDIANFKPFDKVLIRVGNKSKWTCDFFSYYHKGFHCIGTDDWSQCIPFNDDTKHLLGTTDMPREEYINW